MGAGRPRGMHQLYQTCLTLGSRLVHPLVITAAHKAAWLQDVDYQQARPQTSRQVDGAIGGFRRSGRQVGGQQDGGYGPQAHGRPPR